MGLICLLIYQLDVSCLVTNSIGVAIEGADAKFVAFGERLMIRTRPTSKLRDVVARFSIQSVSAGLLSGLFGVTTSLIIIGAGTDAGLSQADIASWIFATFFFGALTGAILSMVYGQPLPGAWSIPGAALVAASLKTFSLPEMVGAYLIANVLVTAVGMSGLMGRVVKLVPLPIVLAMLTGVLMGFGTGIIKSLAASPMIAGATIVAYFAAYPIRNRFPPILVAFCAACAVAAIAGRFEMHASTGFIAPRVLAPQFSVASILSVSIPLAVLVVCGEMPKAFGVLLSQGYKPPVNAITMWCGAAGIIVAFFGGTNVNIAGPMAAICAAPDAGRHQDRYVSVLVNALIFGGFGILASVAVPLVVALPGALINTIAGLAMINVLIGALQNSFGAGRFQTGAFFALIISLAGVPFLGIAAPVWSIAGGVLVSLLIERQDFTRTTAVPVAALQAATALGVVP